jgi:hypothetical protein
MIPTRSATRLLVLAAAVLSQAAAARAADTVLAPAPNVAGLTAYGGQVVMSQLDPATSMWGLVRYAGGALTRLPVAERAVPFDADAGPDATGAPVVVYSRCSHEPAARGLDLAPTPDWETASGCEIYELTLTGTPTERKLTAASAPHESETTPSIWRGNLAFVRHGAGAAVPTIEYLRQGATKPSHLAGGSVQDCTQNKAQDIDCSSKSVHDTVDQLDLGPSRIAYVWNLFGGAVSGIGVATELRSAPLGGSVSTLLDTGLVSGTCGFGLPSAPTAAAAPISYLDARSDCDVAKTSFATVDPVTGIRALAATPGLAAGAARDGATIYWLRVTGPPADVPVPGSGSCSVADAACELVASSAPSYAPQPPQLQIPPADVDLARSGLGYKWVSGPDGTRLLRPPATIPCAPSAVPAQFYVSAQWTRGKHTVRVSRKDPGKPAKGIAVITRSLPDGLFAAAPPRLQACGDSTRITYTVGTRRITFAVARLR